MTQTDIFGAPATVAPPPRPSSIRYHAIWTRLAPFVRVELAAKSETGSGRFRLELRDVPRELMVEALDVVVSCADCHRPMSPVRFRKKPENRRSDVIGHGAFLAVCCPIGVRIGCSRGGAARDEYRSIRAAVESLEVDQ